MRHLSHTILSAMILISLVACRTQTASTYIGVLSAGDPTPSVAAEQQTGYQLKNDAFGFTPQREMESVVQDELQKTVRKLVETIKVVAVIGSTSNEATARTAALVNFFNVPMIIPTADGDNLMPENNLWAFQLSAPGSAYAHYLFGEVLNKQVLNDFKLDNDTLKNFKVAILYEQNTFGENAAVAAAESAMNEKVEIKLNDNDTVYGMEIGVYGNFPDKNPDIERLNNLVSQVKDQGIQLVYLVTSDGDIAQKLVQTFHDQYDSTDTPLPILVGQSGAFASQAFMTTPEAAEVVILRQKWNRDRCPEAITSSYAGQAYGALYLLNNAINIARDNMPKPKFSLSNNTQSDQLTKFRENVRDALKQGSVDVPCVGMVSFDNTGHNKQLNFELIAVKDKFERVLSTTDFLELLKQRIMVQPF